MTKTVKLTLIVLFLLIFCCCLCLGGAIVWWNVGTSFAKNQAKEDTSAICNDKDFVEEIRQIACEDEKEDGEGDWVQVDIRAFKYQIGDDGDMLIYRRSYPGPMQAVSSENLYIQYKDKYVGSIILQTDDWNHGIFYGIEGEVKWSENEDVIWFFVENNIAKDRENYQLFEYSKVSGQMYYYDLFGLYSHNSVINGTEPNEWIKSLDPDNHQVTMQLEMSDEIKNVPQEKFKIDE